MEREWTAVTVDELVRSLRAPDQDGSGRTRDLGTDNIGKLAALDRAASTIRSWDETLIPGLLQIPEYSAGAIRTANPYLPEAEVRWRVARKGHRLHAFIPRLGSPSDLTGGARFVVGESALTRAPKSLTPQSMIAQLRYLLGLSENPRLVIQVLPGHIMPPGLTHNLLIYTFADDGSTARKLGYIETVIGGWYSTRSEDITKMMTAFSDLADQALSMEESRRTIRGVIARWRAALASHTSPEPTTGDSSSSPATP